MLGVKCTAFRYTASGRQYCDETAGGLAPANTAKTPWRAAAARVGGSGGGLSAPTKSPQLDYDDELFFEGNKVRRVLSPLPAQARPHAALRLFLADLPKRRKERGSLHSFVTVRAGNVAGSCSMLPVNAIPVLETLLS